MRVCLMLPELRPSGGVRVALGLAERLRETDEFEIDVFELADAGSAGGRYDVAVATWWETVPCVLGLDAGTHVMLVQSAEERFYRPAEHLERLGAALALTGPMHFFVVARWLADLLSELRPEVRTWHVPNGIDKSVFAPPAARGHDGPLRILVEGQHSLWFKGVQDALEAIRHMREPREVTLVSLDPDGAPQTEDVRMLGNLDPAGMRDEYASHDVLLKLSRVESVGLPVVEACHMGLPCLVAPYTGHDEVIRHGENGLVVGFDDPDGVAHVLDRLARAPAALRSLSEGAVESMRTWPTPDQAAEAFAEALREAHAAPAAAPGSAVFERWRVAAEQARVSLAERNERENHARGSVAWLEEVLATTRTAIEARDDWLRRREQQVADLEEQLVSIRGSRTYRVALALQQMMGRRRR